VRKHPVGHLVPDGSHRQVALVNSKGRFGISQLDMGLKSSACDRLKAKIRSVAPGAVNAEVVLVLASGQEVVATITNGSVKSLDLAEGVGAYAVIKASSVLVAVE
jgi:molybdopterin-binding protein